MGKYEIRMIFRKVASNLDNSKFLDNRRKLQIWEDKVELWGRCEIWMIFWKVASSLDNRNFLDNHRNGEKRSKFRKL